MALDEADRWDRNRTEQKQAERATALAQEEASRLAIAAKESAACAKLRADNPDDSDAIDRACVDRPVDSVNVGLVSSPGHINKPRRAVPQKDETTTLAVESELL